MEVMERGGGGVGNFRVAGISFRYKIPRMNFFRPWYEYFLGLIGVHEIFFHLIFPCAKIFFVLRPLPPPPYNFSNGRPLKGYVTLIAIF